MNDKVLDFVCENLPEDWEIHIIAREGELSVDLFDPDGDGVEICDDDSDLSQMIIDRVNHARVADGLAPTEYKYDSV